MECKQQSQHLNPGVLTTTPPCLLPHSEWFPGLAAVLLNFLQCKFLCANCGIMLYYWFLNGIRYAYSHIEEQNRRENEPRKAGGHPVLLQASFGSFWTVECHIARPLISGVCSSSYRKAVFQLELHESDLSLIKAQMWKTTNSFPFISHWFTGCIWVLNS